ncbi:MAG: hypothetical protein H6Q14_2201 [Bacteroidetes bacterium]|nr:hypothetical protein [Bacteroidota bacterium]
MTENFNIVPEINSGITQTNTETAEKEPKSFKGCGCKPKGCGSCTTRATKLEVYDWLSDIPESEEASKMVEVQFKNTRKGYFLNSNNIDLYVGDMVAVEASPGHDIGHVTLTGKLVQIQMKKNNYRPHQGEQKRVYRIAKPVDIEKYEQAKLMEHTTMIRAREVAENLGLQMKIGDVEYQGDGNKAIFYYIADERVDFRQLIKVFAEEFHVRIEMKQIGARQEAGRIGGIGPCGRELCCSSWMTNFVSVSTSAARYQDISLNPQKLAGQCGKLKCCLNYEIDQYVEAHKQLPSQEVILETLDGSFFHFKTDVFSGQMTYSSSRSVAANLVTVPKERVFDIIQMNKAGTKPKNLNEGTSPEVDPKRAYNDVLENESITRFDSAKKKKKKLNRSQSGQPRNLEGQPLGAEPRGENGASAANANSGGSRREDRPKNQSRPDRQQQANPNKQRANGNRPPHNNNGQRKDFKKRNDNPSQN